MHMTLEVWRRASIGHKSWGTTYLSGCVLTLSIYSQTLLSTCLKCDPAEYPLLLIQDAEARSDLQRLVERVMRALFVYHSL